LVEKKFKILRREKRGAIRTTGGGGPHPGTELDVLKKNPGRNFFREVGMAFIQTCKKKKGEDEKRYTI